MTTYSDPAYGLRSALLAGIRDGRWRPGERIPTERALCDTHAVGRSTVRRVLAELKEGGLITQTVGSGTYVTGDAREKLPALPDENDAVFSPAQLMDARMLLEPALIDAVVRNATSLDFRAMEECCDKGEAAGTLEQFEYWDAALHQKLAEATHNAVCVSVFAQLRDARNRGEWGVIKRKSVTPERRATYQREHRELVEALKNRDRDAAHAALLAHLVTVRQNMLGY
jgi:DNA-binding FadR family transcriptional regulator